MNPLRALLAALAVSVALVLQVSVFPYVAWQGVVPNLVLLVVVGAAVVRGAQFAMVLGFAAGVLLDLAPPADHVAGRWALAFVLVGYVAGRVAQHGRPTATTVLATVAASSFLGTSLFALSGLVLRDPPLTIPDLLQVVLVSVVWDVVLTPFVLPLVMTMFHRIEPERAVQ
ncbi:rod shape-determining protein MreD [Nocardioides sp. 503]|uniref:rod shape-determining protein MreD n=1 Tax=Nocardioides sp. 503 TaxID=2508326 RepID=UPI00106F6586|nr:rod shape-determining protein MreD [Nocardioides sp. 503]